VFVWCCARTCAIFGVGSLLFEWELLALAELI
jgi:hypothetical protein